MAHTATMSRRDFFKKPIAQKPLPTPTLLSALDPYTSGPLSTADLVHLLKRTMFGVKKDDLTFFTGKTLPDIVDNYLLNFTSSPVPTLPDNYYQEAWQLDYAAKLRTGQDPLGFKTMIPAPPVNDYDINETRTAGGETHTEYLKDLEVNKGSCYLASRHKGDLRWDGVPNTANADNQINWNRHWSMQGWWCRQLLNQERTIREKMTLFWHNFFPTNWKVAQMLSNSEWWQNQTLRYHCIGDFKALLKDMSLSSTMLMFLDGYQNTKNTPNQNYGRELQELFCIGLPAQNSAATGSNSYNEQDVIEVSRILTGWGFCDPSTGSCWMPPFCRAYFTPSNHDTGNKQLSAFYNNAVITGRAGVNGAKEFDDLLAIMFALPHPALNVARKVYRFFVTPEIDADTETNVIEPLAQILRANNYQIKPMMSALLKSQHFFDKKVRGAQIKSPFEFVIGAFREIPNIFSHVPTHPMYDRYLMECSTLLMERRINDLGSIYYSDAFGWKAYYYAPHYDQSWVNANSLYKRKNYFSEFINSSYSRRAVLVPVTEDDKNWYIKVDLPVYIKNTFPNAANATALRDAVIEYMFSVELCAQAKATLLSKLQPANWTFLWNLYANNVNNATNKAAVNTRLIDFFNAIASLEEYHLM